MFDKNLSDNAFIYFCGITFSSPALGCLSVTHDLKFAKFRVVMILA